MFKNIAKPRKIPDIKHIIAVSSCKGGVGKSTVAVNLSLALHSLGFRTGLLDADIFGPSIPRMMNLDYEAEHINGKFRPLVNYGIECMSMGFLIPKDSPIVWRGMMVAKGIQQLLWDISWTSRDFLVIDLPPGTGDVQLTISQQLKIDGALIVSTPQDIALLDAIRGLNMFKKVHVPVLGRVQNMSFFKCPNCNHETHIFESNTAEKLDLELLAEFPLDPNVCKTCDTGKPIVVSNPDSYHSKEFLNLAHKISAKVSIPQSSA